MERASIYCRVSTDGQGDNTSLESQMVRCRAYCSEHGYSVVAEEQEVHSGGDLDGRRGLLRLREMVRRGEVDVLVVFAVDRLARDFNHQGVLVYEIEEQAGARIESATEDLSGHTGAILRAVAGVLATMEREKIRERTMRGKTERLREGNVPTATSNLYGYETVKVSKEERLAGGRAHRRLVEVQAGVVREIYGRIAEGWSLQGIATDLNDRGVPSPAANKFRFKDGRRMVWQASTISQMIVNPAYKGVTVGNRMQRVKARNKVVGYAARPEEEWIRVDDTGRLTPAIVSTDLWQRANDRMAANRGARARNIYLPKLLRGHLTCAVCGAPLYADHDTRNGRRQYYRCRRSKMGKREIAEGQIRCPERVAVRVDELDTWVWSEVEAVLADRDAVLREIRQRLSRPDETGITAERDRLIQELAKLDRRAETTLRAFTESEGRLPWKTFEPSLLELEELKEEVRKALSAVESRLDSERVRAVKLTGLEELVQQLGPRLADPDFETRAQVLTELGVEVLVTRTSQVLTWALPLPAGTERDMVFQLNLSGVANEDQGRGAASNSSKCS